MSRRNTEDNEGRNQHMDKRIDDLRDTLRLEISDVKTALKEYAEKEPRLKEILKHIGLT